MVLYSDTAPSPRGSSQKTDGVIDPHYENCISNLNLSLDMNKTDKKFSTFDQICVQFCSKPSCRPWYQASTVQPSPFVEGDSRW